MKGKINSIVDSIRGWRYLPRWGVLIIDLFITFSASCWVDIRIVSILFGLLSVPETICNEFDESVLAPIPINRPIP